MDHRGGAGQVDPSVGGQLEQAGPGDAGGDLEQAERAELGVQVAGVGGRAGVDAERGPHDGDRLHVRVPVDRHVEVRRAEASLRPTDGLDPGDRRRVIGQNAAAAAESGTGSQ